MLNASFEELWEEGCIQTGRDDPTDKLEDCQDKFKTYFAALMLATQFNPCLGCPAFKNSHCVAYRRFNTLFKPVVFVPKLDATIALGTKKYPGMSVKQIADKLGVSKKEVKRRKLLGTL